MTLRVGLIGARGYVGREMLTLIARHAELELSYASSREWDGKLITDMLGGDVPSLNGMAFEALAPEEAVQKNADVVILGLPNRKSAPFMEEIDRTHSDSIIIDLSGDHRHHDDWVYGLPERNREFLRGAKRIANPGCYASAAQLALLPLKGCLEGPVHVFGLSGWSGAGTTPSRKNDPDALRDNAIPYGLTGHCHEKEIAVHADESIRFMPCVAPFFRGLVTTVSATLRDETSEEDLQRVFVEAYGSEPFIELLEEPAEPASVAKTHQCKVGFQLAANGRGLVITSALDNLLKGAASVAIQNLNLALGFSETTGLNAKS